MARDSRFVAGIIVLAFWIGSCSEDDTSTPADVPHDADADAPPDTPADTPTTTHSVCLRSCTTADDCCLTAGRPCGQYPNRWTCDAACMVASCTDHAECVSWATDLGLPGAAGYKCETRLVYWPAGYCVPGCTTPEDCCPTGVDCSVYPQRRSCDAGACKMSGCEGDTECRDWATDLGAPNPANWVCRTPAFRDTGACTVACTTTDDCCPGGCAAYPRRLACVAGYCVSSCLDDAECRDWATGAGAENPAGYVCHSFTY
jgi:hypothetical protein